MKLHTDSSPHTFLPAETRLNSKLKCSTEAFRKIQLMLHQQLLLTETCTESISQRKSTMKASHYTSNVQCLDVPGWTWTASLRALNIELLCLIRYGKWVHYAANNLMLLNTVNRSQSIDHRWREMTQLSNLTVETKCTTLLLNYRTDIIKTLWENH